VALTGDSLPLKAAGNGVEFATADLMLYAVKVSGNGINSGGVSDKYNPVSQIFGL
jgi:hypothetical protein